MTISKLDQLDRDYTRVAKTRPWLIPIAWSPPLLIHTWTESAIKEHNARLKDAYRHRKARAVKRAQAIVEATTRLVGRAQQKVSSGLPEALAEGLPRGWRSRELRGNRRAPGSTESLRKLATSTQRARLRVSGWGPW